MDRWWKYPIYLLPFLLSFVALSSGLIYVGESMPLLWVVEIQRMREDVLYRPQFGNRDQQYKVLAINARQPEVVAIGSSRILQFRAGFFNLRPDAFYNAAGPAWRLEQITRVIYNIDSTALPRVLILAIDPPWFNSAYEGYKFPEEMTELENIVFINRTFIEHFVVQRRNYDRSGLTSLWFIARHEPGSNGGLALGLRAIRDGHGFRSDGSEQFGDFLVAHWLIQSQMRELHMAMMKNGEDMYVYGSEVSATALNELAALLDYAVQHGITVVGYLPPYAPTLWTVMNEQGNHSYIGHLTIRLRETFAAHGFTFFDFSDGRRINSADEEFFDGWHASELSNLRLYIELLEALPDVFGAYSDYRTLSVLAATSPNTWDVFGFGNERTLRP